MEVSLLKVNNMHKLLYKHYNTLIFIPRIFFSDEGGILE